jgi:putative peptide zinc metalloprotease protein
MQDDGTPVVLVTHQVTIAALAGRGVASGTGVVLRLDGSASPGIAGFVQYTTYAGRSQRPPVQCAGDKQPGGELTTRHHAGAAAPALPPLREDLRLFPGPSRRDGSPTWRILDPVRNRFYEIGRIEFELLSHWHAQCDRRSLLARVARSSTARPTEEELEDLLEFLVRHQLVRPAGKPALQDLKRRWLAEAKPWHRQLLHHYLFFRVPLLRPDAFLAATLPWISFVFTKHFALFLAVLAAVDFHLVFRRWDEVTAAFYHFFSLQGLFYYLLAATFAKVVHELGHAYCAKRLGVRVPTMGVAFLVLWPVLYTDTGETWKLRDPRRRFAIAASGVGAELALALFAVLAWSIAADGPFKSMFFLLATSTLITTLAINASPFMRFDGYFLLSDALDLPNLHERSFALCRHWLRRAFFGLVEDDPEPGLPPAWKRNLVLFALATWTYRLVIFLAIALLIYHLFFKVLGIALMVVELAWFIGRPVALELRHIWERRSLLRPRLRAFAAFFALLAAAAWFFPIASHVKAPALLKADREHEFYAPFPARLEALHVKPGQHVEPGTLLARLESPELRHRLIAAELRARSYATELARTPSSREQRERAPVLQKQLEEVAAQHLAAQADIARLELRTPIAGVVLDLPDDVQAERWMNPRQLVMRVVSSQGAHIDAYVGESLVGALRPGQRVRFYPQATNLEVIEARVDFIDPVAVKTVPHPLLASVYGGGIASVKNEQGRLMANEAVYRVRIAPEQPIAGVASVARGTVHIDTGLVAISQNFFSRAASLLIRESGF